MTASAMLWQEILKAYQWEELKQHRGRGNTQEDERERERRGGVQEDSQVFAVSGWVLIQKERDQMEKQILGKINILAYVILFYLSKVLFQNKINTIIPRLNPATDT